MPPPFSDLLEVISERSELLRTAVASADDLQAGVPGCPDWTLRDLVVHVGQVQRSWAAKVRAGRAGAPGVEDLPTGDLLAWSEESTEILIRALRDVGPDAPCWTWWEDSDAPSTSGAVARHQVQEAALHAYDAQSVSGTADELPTDIASDSIDEFLVVSLGAMGAWPHAPARVDFVAAEGPRWTVDLSSVAKVTVDAEGVPAATVIGPAAELILALYSRIPSERLQVDGDAGAVKQLLAWAAMSTD
ncbi:maleylpyruvate isomerase family mycothiol-dependent enzyme [Mycolicibacterium hodleri]|uniref:Maleylpyruvate isomerase family mycothiol-dependent enzyme n=1 Tax=Mycolicibacterium hodleri TaxID=49897 RepID=A0A502E650_9MYCO|nr:maleylpyruvate isomerase family mycothiol-dependent enzyme [Mycolicibacterium hodleri]TPG33178.1 maleylpyruvate isomerase family mycothiol-dependent enzyme [Mycolicibacterium hodleri]